MLSLDITVEDPAWHTHCPDLEALSARVLETALASVPSFAGRAGPFELSLLFTDNDTIQRLNCEFRNKDKPTNILSFPMIDAQSPQSPIQPLGDLALALGVVLEECAVQSKTPADHLSHLLVHGFLHLIGHDHESDGEAKAMENLEIAILDRLGLKNPYSL